MSAMTRDPGDLGDSFGILQPKIGISQAFGWDIPVENWDIPVGCFA
jgi:hypothetical protein